MSTLSVPSKSSEGTFSYAAAASGKHSPKPTTAQSPPQTTTQTSNSGTSTPNGIAAETTKGQATETVPVIPLEACSTPKQKSSNAPSNAANGTLVNGESSPSSISLDQKQSIDEKSSSCEKGLPAEGDKTDISKQAANTGELAKEKLVPAPPPPVNIWSLRAEEFRAKAKLQPNTVPVTAPVAASKHTSSKASEKITEAKQGERKRGSKHTDSGSLDAEKLRESGAHDRKDAPKEGRDRKKSADAGRVNGYLPREDGNIRHGKTSKHLSKSGVEKESTTAELLPSLGDATSWPTPETAQDEEKKEKERLQAEKEKEKTTVARSSGPTKFVPAPFTPTIVHNAPLPTKSGRGGRGGRSSTTGRGGNTSLGQAEGRQEKVDKSEKAVSTNPLSQSGEDRGRISSRGTGVGGRGNYHGSSRGGRRAGSVGSNSHRKPDSPANLAQEKRESQPAANQVSSAAPEATVESASRKTSQGGETRSEAQNPARQSEYDGAFIGQGVIPPQYAERIERAQRKSFSTTNGQGGQKAEGSNTHTEGFPHGRPERGSVSARGGYRGRGGHYNAPHPHVSHSNAIASQPYYQHHNQSQYAPHTPSYRTFGRGSRGHSAHPRGYHQHYQPGVFPNQQFAQPYGGYYDYNVNPINNTMNSMPMLSANNSSTPPAPDDSLAQRDYPHGGNPHFYANLLENVSKQMNYYFSVDNLCRDIWLRKQMDSNGWICLSVFSNFPAIQKQTNNIQLLRDACENSADIEVQLAADGYRVRKAKDHQLFVLPKNQRSPEVLQREEMDAAAAQQAAQQVAQQVTQQAPQQVSAPTSAHLSESSRPQMSASAEPFQPHSSLQSATQSAPPVLNGPHTPVVDNSDTNGIERTQSHLSADAVEFTMPNGFTLAAPVSHTELQTANFPDEQIGHIIIVYKKSLLTNSTSPESSPTVNGEISSTCNSDDGTESCQCSPRSGRLSRHGVGWTLGQDPEDPNLYKHEHEEYTKIRDYSLQKRRDGEPDSAKITILCRFWSHFLLNQFNKKMYEDFKSFAMDNAQATAGLSLEILFGFYEAIHVIGSPREEMTRDFVELVARSASSGFNVGRSRLESTLSNPILRAEVRNILQSTLRTPADKTV